MATKKGKSRLAKADAIIEEQVESIDEQLEVVEDMLKPYAKIKERADRLRSARRALLGGSKVTGAGGTQLRQQDVKEFLMEHPGATPSQIAEKHGVAQPTVSSHLQRGKDERFITDGSGHWWVRDPKNGIHSYEDIQNQED
jgi:DNA-binding CsgD family transcriptional regulator